MVYIKKIVGLMLFIFIMMIIVVFTKTDNSFAANTTLAAKVISLNKGTSYTQGNGNGVYRTNSHEYRYIGSNPDNYVWFNNDMYRIIGVFDNYTHGISGANLVKIIRNRSLFTSTYASHNTGNNTGEFSTTSNDWTGSQHTTPSNTSILLNEFFYNKTKTSSTYGDCANWTNISSSVRTNNCSQIVGYGINDTYREYIQSVKWYLYGYNDCALSKANMYKCERGAYSGCTSAQSGTYDTSTIAPIGLLYPSDYCYASGYIAMNGTEQISNIYFASSNWLFIGQESTITPRNDNYAYHYHVYSAGLGSTIDTKSGQSSKRPTFYLKADVYVTGGTGTFDNPYTVACDNCSS